MSFMNIVYLIAHLLIYTDVNIDHISIREYIILQMK